MKIPIISVGDSHGYGRYHLWFVPYMITEGNAKFQIDVNEKKVA